MGKVYVLAKADSAIQQTVSPQGMGLTINTSPENLDYTKFGVSHNKLTNRGSNQNRLARKFGNVGAKARFGLGALGGLNAFYNATSSGQPGAISSIGSGAMSGYYGSQGLENLAAKQGAKIGVKRDNKESAAAYDEAQGDNQQYNHYDEAQGDNQQYNASLQHPSVARRTEYMANRPKAVAERESRANQSNTGQVGVLGNAGGSGSPNIFSDNYANTQRHQQMMNKIPAPPAPPPGHPTGAPPPGTDGMDIKTATNSNFTPSNDGSVTPTQTTLGQYGQQDPSKQVAVLDTEKVKNMQNESEDGASAAKVAGA